MGERLRLYHTGFHELRAPDITVGRKNAARCRTRIPRPT